VGDNDAEKVAEVPNVRHGKLTVEGHDDVLIRTIEEAVKILLST
jgi:hypothetical protein